jgi:dihydrodipicolinate synthase/N-acetylneuraminate lyase
VGKIKNTFRGVVGMAKIRKIEGILPSACVPFTDSTCKTIDEEALRVHYRYLLKFDLGGLVVGGHMGEMPYLSIPERRRVTQIAVEEGRGKRLIIGGICSDSTHVAVEQGLEVKELGGDAVLFTPPAISAWNMSTDDDRAMIEHFTKFDKEVNIPFIIMASPISLAHGISVSTLKNLAQRFDNFVAMKIPTGWNTGAFRSVVIGLKSVRDVGCLVAGSSNNFGILCAGGDGNLSGAGNFLAGPDVELLKAFKAGDLVKAKAIADKIAPVVDILDGYSGLPRFYYHYRFKIGAWLMGLIPRPHMRLPQMPPPKKEIEMLGQAMTKAGMKVVHEAEELAIANY